VAQFSVPTLLSNSHPIIESRVSLARPDALGGVSKGSRENTGPRFQTAQNSARGPVFGFSQQALDLPRILASQKRLFLCAPKALLAHPYPSYAELNVLTPVLSFSNSAGMPRPLR